MSHLHRLSLRERSLAVVAVALLVIMVAVGYAKSSQAGVLVAQDKNESDIKNQQQNIKDRQNYFKDIKREIQDVKKTAKNYDTSKVEALLTQWETCVNALSSQVGVDGFWNAWNDCDAHRTDLDDMMTEARVQRDCSQFDKQINDRRKEKKNNIDRQVKDILREDKTADVSALTNILARMDAQFALADQLASGVCTQESRDALNDVQSELNPLFQEFYSGSDEVRQRANSGRRIKEQAKDLVQKTRNLEKDKATQLKATEKELARAIKSGADTSESQAAYDSAKQLYQQMADALVLMKAAVDNKDPDAYDDARTTYDDADREFWDILNQSRQSAQEQNQRAEQLKNATRELKRWTSELGKMKKNVTRLQKLYTKTAKKYASNTDRKEALAAFGQYVADVVDLTKKIEEGVATAKAEMPTDPDSFWMDHQDELNELQTEFYDMQQKVQMIGQIMDTLSKVEKDLKSAPKELAKLKKESNNDADLMSALQEILDNSNVSVKEAWSLAITSPEDAMNALQSLQDMGQEWDDAVNEWRSAQEMADWKEGDPLPQGDATYY